MKERMYIHPSKVVVLPDRIRQNFDQGELEKLKSSILQIGQKQPILITREMELVVGERRTRACIDLDKEVWAVYEDEADPVLLKEIELAENLYRANLTPTEVILAKDELRRLREEQHKEQGYTAEDLADELGESKSNTARDLKMACFVKAAPQMFEKCKTKQDVARVIKGLERQIQWRNLQEAASNLPKAPTPAKVMKDGEEVVTEGELAERRKQYIQGRIRYFHDRLLVGNAFEHLPHLRGVQIMLLDPPWGVDHHLKQEIGLEVEAGYEDKKEDFYEKFPELCRLCYEAMAKDSHLYCFFGIVHSQFVYECLEKAGFTVNRRPIILCKLEGKGIPRASTRVPDIWPGAGYEPVAFARKGGRKLARRRVADWASYKWPTVTEKKGHPSAKPPQAYIDLLRRSAYPGDVVCDPMYGSGAAFVACEMMPDLSLQWTGWEEKEQFRDVALMNLTEMVLKGGVE